MYVCRNCGQAYSDYTPNCVRCGGEIVAAAPTEPVVHSAPSYAPYGATPAYHYESKPAAPKVTGGAIAMGIIGFILALESLFGMFISAAFSVNTSYDYYYDYYDSYFDVETYAVAMFFQVIMSVVGLVFSSIARNKGFCGLAVAGKVISIIGIVINSIIFFLALIGESVF